MKERELRIAMHTTISKGFLFAIRPPRWGRTRQGEKMVTIKNSVNHSTTVTLGLLFLVSAVHTL